MTTGRIGQVQFGRVIEVTFGPKGGGAGRTYRDLAMKAEIEKNDGKKPNPGKVTIWGLNQESVDVLRGDNVQITVRAGYVTSGQTPPKLFSGDVDDVKQGGLMPGEDLSVEIEARDGGAIWDNVVFSEGLEGPTSPQAVIEKVAESMGVGVRFAPGVKDVRLENGFMGMGMGRDVLSQVASLARLDWTLQDDQLVVTPQGEPVSNEIFLIDSGQVTSIKPYEKGKGRQKKKGWEVVVFLNPHIKPKTSVQLDTKAAKGLFKVRSVKSSVATWDDDFFMTLTLEG